ncbi:nidogen-2 [Oryzias latipes]|uniref:Nidogen 2 n=1 Tax=Oryzias latipes TaxID=8090 RepID=H2LFW9_ORYLA|nr:nidogen-2 [Oryzias latipes]
MDRGSLLTVSLLCWSCGAVTAIRRADLFPFGTSSGDSLLAEGDDETSKVLILPKPFYFYNSQFSLLYVATNGIVSAQDLPMEKQYVDDGFPTDFPVVAPFLADIDTSGGRGQIYYRVTETPSVLNRLTWEVSRGFPDAKFTPTHAVVATWENVAAYEEPSRSSGSSNRVNTFQAVIAYDETDSYVLFLYPEDGLNFFGTRPKESYNVEIELPARVGFSRGEVTYFFFSRSEGPSYSVTSDEQSVKNLNRVGNTGTPGLWLFHTGHRYSFDNVIPASVGGPIVTAPPRRFVPDTTTPEYEVIYTLGPEIHEDDEYSLTGRGPAASNHFQYLQPGSPEPSYSPPEDSGHQVLLGSEPRYGPEPAGRQYAPPEQPQRVLEGGARQGQEQIPQLPLEVVDLYPPDRNTPGGYVVNVEEDDVHFDTRVIQYTTDNKETCARFQQQCSQNAFCSDYATGFCCHCQPGFYGNGRDCLPEGAPQRVSGKVSGTVSVQSTPVTLNNIDLHAYIVVGDGRAYSAISEVPEPLGWALMPVSPIGELFGWLFALELPNSQAGFKSTGAKFTRHAEVQFYPGNHRLSILQTGRGLDEHNLLNVDTVVSGNVPFIPPEAEITVEPFKETYQYYPSVVTSTSAREIKVVSASRGAESYSLNLKQNITYRECRHDNRASNPETLQITMERVFVMYDKDERILRYAVTNKIGPVGADPVAPELINPCYSGNHDCDTTAMCIPQEDQNYECQCATGYGGDGRNCYDIDECAEGVSSCGEHSECLNLPGSHRCLCSRGFEFAYDGRTCVDIDECSSSPCHINARCINELGSFQCLCQPGFTGDGFFCSQQEDLPARPKTRCEHHRESVQRTTEEGAPLLGVYVPQCDESGKYLPQQCHDSTGYCWCVDSTGQERTGTRTPPGSALVDCSRTDEQPHYKTRCERHREHVLASEREDRPSVGAYVPQCDQNGEYVPQQCHTSTGYCWCVDGMGQERSGTRSAPGSPSMDCSKPDEALQPKTPCERLRESVLASSAGGRPLAGAYAPQCDEDGHYVPRQCHGSSGYCWCVDSSGQERPGTRTSPGAPSVDCSRAEEPEAPKTECELLRERAMASSPEAVPAAGRFVPQCDAEGRYLSQQCHGSTGHCWCVDSRGQERPGTRTPPGVAQVDCYQRPEPEPPYTRPESVCERWRASLMEHYGGKPQPQQYLPQCRSDGEFSPVQCYGETTYCWCVDQDGREIDGTRSHDAVKPACLSSVAPPTVLPLPRPDVTPPTNADVTLLYAQGQKIDALPLNGTKLHANGSKTLLTLHGSIVVGIAYDCRENQVYWTDLSARTINRASLVSGSEPEILISSNLESPEGLAVDVQRRLMFWVDSSPDNIEVANLDGSERRTLFDTDLVNPRAIIVVSSKGTLYWTDWNREAPKIECSTVNGQNRRVVVSDGVGLPNALAYDHATDQVCWADAGTKRLECVSPNGSGRRVIHRNLNYPFSMVYYRDHFYYTDWRRDGVIAVNRDSNKLTEEYLPDQRSHLYGIAVATNHCLQGSH